MIFFNRFCLLPIRNEMEDTFYLTLDEKLFSVGENKARQGKKGKRRGRDGPSHLHSLEILFLPIPEPGCWSRKTGQAEQDIWYSSHWGGGINQSIFSLIRTVKWDVAWCCVCMCVYMCAHTHMCCGFLQGMCLRGNHVFRVFPLPL